MLFQSLVSKGRIELDDDLGAWVAKALQKTACREAPLTSDVVLTVPKIQFAHKDPADHFIAGTAKAFDLTLVTSDPRLLALKSQGISILSNG